MGMMSASVLSVRSSEFSESTNHIAKIKSDYVAVGAIEYALHELAWGLSPSTPAGGLDFAGGNFEVDADPALGTVSVVGDVQGAQTEYDLNARFSKDCIELSFDDAQFVFEATSGGLEDLKYRKKCHHRLILSGMVITWDSPSGVQKIRKITCDNGNELQDLYQGWSIPYIGTPEDGANSGEQINVADLMIENDSWLTCTEITMSYAIGEKPSDGTQFSFLLQFADGSEYLESIIYEED